MTTYLRSILHKFLDNQYPILKKPVLSKLLETTDVKTIHDLWSAARHVRRTQVGRKVYYRGLIEISNYCTKNCYYCGLRKNNKNTTRYTMDFEDVQKAVEIAYKSRMGSLVIQSGELLTPKFYDYMGKVLKHIQDAYQGEMRVTLSLGELPKEVLKEYRRLGATRYLLRIESSSRELYYKLHPEDHIHSYENRLKCLEYLRELDFHVGTGVMIGLPYQTAEILAEDLLFMKNIDVDMVGMGPYVEHEDTPLAHIDAAIPSRQKRIELSYRMISLLRLMLPDINIASTTALQTLDPRGRERGVDAGANVIMPNLSESKYRDKYFLYEGKPSVNDKPETHMDTITRQLGELNYEVAYGKFGDSLHYLKRKKQLKL